MLKYYRIFVAAALVISLMMNFYLFSKLEWIQSDVNSIYQEQFQIYSTVNGQTHHIENVMSEIQKEQSWISPMNMDVTTSEVEKGQGEVAFQWQIKEYPVGADVTFHYSFGDREGYSTIQPVEVRTGMFEVKVPFETELEPIWEVRTNTAYGESWADVEEQPDWENDRSTQLKYYVSMNVNDVLKSSTTETIYLDHFDINHYGMIMTDVTIEKNNVFVNVNNDFSKRHFLVEEAYIKTYMDGEFVEEVQLTTDEYEGEEYYHPKHFYLQGAIKSDSFTSLVVKVVYSSGEVFEKEIY